MGTEGAYPPYNFINDDGEIDGFERALGDELCRRANLECIWVTNEWESIIANLVAGDYDTILAGMSITDERDETIDFTQAYIPPSASVYVSAGRGRRRRGQRQGGRPGGHYPGRLSVPIRRSAAGVRPGPRTHYGRPERPGGCGAGRPGVRQRKHRGTQRKVDAGRPGGDVGRTA